MYFSLLNATFYHDRLLLLLRCRLLVLEECFLDLLCSSSCLDLGLCFLLLFLSLLFCLFKDCRSLDLDLFLLLCREIDLLLSSSNEDTLEDDDEDNDLSRRRRRCFFFLSFFSLSLSLSFALSLHLPMPAPQSTTTMRCKAIGLSLSSTSTLAISLITSIPRTTLPNATCFPSKCNALPRVTKNCDPFVLAPRFAMLSIPSASCLIAKDSSGNVSPYMLCPPLPSKDAKSPP